MKKKIRPSEKKSKEIEAILKREGALAIEEFHQLAQEKLYQETVETEADEFLGRKWHKRGEKGKKFKGYRNGYSSRKLSVPGSRIEVRKPKMRQTGGRKFVSRILKGC